jgi:hypothetical protein
MQTSCMEVLVNFMSHHDLITPQKEVLWLLELTTIRTCDIVDTSLSSRAPFIYGVRQPAQSASQKRIMHEIPSISMCEHKAHITEGENLISRDRRKERNCWPWDTSWSDVISTLPKRIHLNWTRRKIFVRFMCNVWL